jgi:hypothetical protein
MTSWGGDRPGNNVEYDGRFKERRVVEKGRIG